MHDHVKNVFLSSFDVNMVFIADTTVASRADRNQRDGKQITRPVISYIVAGALKHDPCFKIQLQEQKPALTIV